MTAMLQAATSSIQRLQSQPGVSLSLVAVERELYPPPLHSPGKCSAPAFHARPQQAGRLSLTQLGQNKASMAVLQAGIKALRVAAALLEG